MPLITLSTTRLVIRAEAILSAMAINSTVVPLPESLSTQCAMGLRIEKQSIEKAENALNNAAIKYDVKYEY